MLAQAFSHTYNDAGNLLTLDIGQAVGTTDNVTFNDVTVSGTLTSDDITSGAILTAGDATITGNSTVQGTTTTVTSNTLDVADINITIADENALGGKPSWTYSRWSRCNIYIY